MGLQVWRTIMSEGIELLRRCNTTYIYVHILINLLPSRELGGCDRGRPQPLPHVLFRVHEYSDAGLSLLPTMYRVFIKYCVFFEDFQIFRSLAFLCFPLVSRQFVYTHTRQVEHQRCSRTGRVQKSHKILRKKHNIYWIPCRRVDLGCVWAGVPVADQEVAHVEAQRDHHRQYRSPRCNHRQKIFRKSSSFWLRKEKE